MNHATPDTRLRTAALLLMTLPALVATACFAHGHGAVGSYALLAVLVAAIAAGAYGAYHLLNLIRPQQKIPHGLPKAATTPTL